MSASSIRRRLALGFTALLIVAATGIFASVQVARQAAAELALVGELAERGRRTARVAGLVREYYMHQAHLALGLHADHHQALARTARTDLAAAFTALEQIGGVRDMTRIGRDIDALERLFEVEFLPALKSGDQARANAIHHRAVGLVDRLVAMLEASQADIAEAIAMARSVAQGASDAATLRAGLILAVAAALALLIVGAISRSIARPVQRLRAAAAELMAGRIDAVPIAGPTEVRALGEALNEMLASLEAQRRARSAAETMAVLGRASAGIAHEINNPLGVILGHARLLERQGAEVAEDAAAIAREARLCQQIVQSLLDYARPGTLTRTPVDLRAVLETICERHGAALHAADPISVPGDTARLTQLFSNLVHNAAAFAEAVTVSVTRIADAARITVIDDGPGVAADRVERIFEPFESARPEGVGLGLPIARSIAIAHGGTLRAEAGPGGRFIVELPLSSPV